MSTAKLYHYFLTVRLQPDDNGSPEAVVESRYPAGDLPKAENTLMGMITQFCFPDKEKFPKHNLSPKSKKFTFVVTNIEGVKRFGYVRRALTGQISISNQGKRWPICHCILSVFPCHSIFDQILEATSRLEPPQVLDLMTQLQNHSLPAPGDAIYATVAVGDPAAPRLEPFRFNRPEQESSLSGFADFKALLTTIDPFTIVTILMALLMERRVIFISRKLSTLSSCVQAAVALLYPFSWQHVFIPVLPLGMIQFVCAPVPFVVGLLTSHLPELQAQAELMDEVLLIDVESSSPVPPSNDFKMVPEKYLLPLAATIAKARKIVLEEKRKPKSDKSKSDKSVGDKLKNFFHSGQSDKSLSTPGARTTVALAEYYRESQPQDNVAKMIENAFISFFAETMGHYANYLTSNSFDKEGFLTFDPTLTPFLKGVAGSQLFEQFIAQRQQSSRIKTKTQTNPMPPRKSLTCHADLSTDAKLAETLIREGYLSKWGKGMKGTAWARLKEGKDHRGSNHEHTVGTFQVRWWKLSYWTLSYHKSEDSKPSGTIQLRDIDAVNLAEFKGVKDCLEIVTAERSFQLHTENNADLMWWFELLNWKLSLIREFYPKTGVYNPTAPPNLPSKESSTNSAQIPPRVSSTVPGLEVNGSTPLNPDVPPSSSPLTRVNSTGSMPSSTTRGPFPAAAKGSFIGNRPASKTIVTAYVKDRLSNERICGSSVPTSDSDSSSNGGSSKLPPPVPTKPSWAKNGSTPPHSGHLPSGSPASGYSTPNGSTPASTPPGSISSVDSTASRGRSSAMRKTSDSTDDAAAQPPPLPLRGVSHSAAPWTSPRSNSTEAPVPHRHTQHIPHAASFSAGSSSKQNMGDHRSGPPKHGHRHAASTRELRKSNSYEEPPMTKDVPEHTTAAAPQTSSRAPLSSALSLSPPVTRKLPSLPIANINQAQNSEEAKKERSLPTPPALKATPPPRPTLTKTVPAPSSSASVTSSAPVPAAKAKSRPLPRPPTK